MLIDARPKMAAADARLLKLISGGGRRATFVSLLRDMAHASAKGEGKAKPKSAKAPKPRKADKKPKKKLA